MKNNKMEVVGSWIICYGLSLNLYGVQYGISDSLLVGWNDEEQVYELTIQYNDNDESYITLDGVNYYLQDCLRV